METGREPDGTAVIATSFLILFFIFPFRKKQEKLKKG
jgi:hypothetical protein